MFNTLNHVSYLHNYLSLRYVTDKRGCWFVCLRHDVGGRLDSAPRMRIILRSEYDDHTPTWDSAFQAIPGLKQRSLFYQETHLRGRYLILFKFLVIFST